MQRGREGRPQLHFIIRQGTGNVVQRTFSASPAPRTAGGEDGVSSTSMEEAGNIGETSQREAKADSPSRVHRQAARVQAPLQRNQSLDPTTQRNQSRGRGSNSAVVAGAQNPNHRQKRIRSSSSSHISWNDRSADVNLGGPNRDSIQVVQTAPSAQSGPVFAPFRPVGPPLPDGERLPVGPPLKDSLEAKNKKIKQIKSSSNDWAGADIDYKFDGAADEAGVDTGQPVPVAQHIVPAIPGVVTGPFRPVLPTLTGYKRGSTSCEPSSERVSPPQERPQKISKGGAKMSHPSHAELDNLDRHTTVSAVSSLPKESLMQKKKLKPSSTSTNYVGGLNGTFASSLKSGLVAAAANNGTRVGASKGKSIPSAQPTRAKRKSAVLPEVSDGATQRALRDRTKLQKPDYSGAAHPGRDLESEASGGNGEAAVDDDTFVEGLWDCDSSGSEDEDNDDAAVSSSRRQDSTQRTRHQIEAALRDLSSQPQPPPKDCATMHAEAVSIVAELALIDDTDPRSKGAKVNSHVGKLCIDWGTAAQRRIVTVPAERPHYTGADAAKFVHYFKDLEKLHKEASIYTVETLEQLDAVILRLEIGDGTAEEMRREFLGKPDSHSFLRDSPAGEAARQQQLRGPKARKRVPEPIDALQPPSSSMIAIESKLRSLHTLQLRARWRFSAATTLEERDEADELYAALGNVVLPLLDSYIAERNQRAAAQASDTTTIAGRLIAELRLIDTANMLTSSPLGPLTLLNSWFKEAAMETMIETLPRLAAGEWVLPENVDEVIALFKTVWYQGRTLPAGVTNAMLKRLAMFYIITYTDFKGNWLRILAKIEKNHVAHFKKHQVTHRRFKDFKSYIQAHPANSLISASYYGASFGLTVDSIEGFHHRNIQEMDLPLSNQLVPRLAGVIRDGFADEYKSKTANVRYDWTLVDEAAALVLENTCTELGAGPLDTIPGGSVPNGDGGIQILLNYLVIRDPPLCTLSKPVLELMRQERCASVKVLHDKRTSSAGTSMRGRLCSLSSFETAQQQRWQKQHIYKTERLAQHGVYAGGIADQNTGKNLHGFRRISNHLAIGTHMAAVYKMCSEEGHPWLENVPEGARVSKDGSRILSEDPHVKAQTEYKSNFISRVAAAGVEIRSGNRTVAGKSEYGYK